MTEELKPCPFDGAPIQVKAWPDTSGAPLGYISCSDPECPLNEHWVSPDFWNTRADTEAATLRAKLDQAMLDRSDANAARDLEHVAVVALQMDVAALRARLAESEMEALDLKQLAAVERHGHDMALAALTEARAEAERLTKALAASCEDARGDFHGCSALARAEAALREIADGRFGAGVWCAYCDVEHIGPNGEQDFRAHKEECPGNLARVYFTQQAKGGTE